MIANDLFNKPEIVRAFLCQQSLQSSFIHFYFLIIMKLIQKHLLKGTREFELRDDLIFMHIKTPFKEKHKDVDLAILNPEPEVKDGMLHFHSRVKCGPLISLFLNKPNEEEFNAFVNAVKEKALKEYNAFAGLSTD